MTLLVAILALIVSSLVLVIQYKNQIERRHGEITHLRAQLLAAYYALRQRLTWLIVQAEAVRNDLRRVPDSEDKFRSIEKLPGTVNSLRQLKQKVDDFIVSVEKMDTSGTSSAVLMRLQKLVSDLEGLDPRARELEDKMISLVELVRSQLKP